jgi:hypothetical protein
MAGKWDKLTFMYGDHITTTTCTMLLTSRRGTAACLPPPHADTLKVPTAGAYRPVGPTVGKCPTAQQRRLWPRMHHHL